MLIRNCIRNDLKETMASSTSSQTSVTTYYTLPNSTKKEPLGKSPCKGDGATNTNNPNTTVPPKELMGKSKWYSQYNATERAQKRTKGLINQSRKPSERTKPEKAEYHLSNEVSSYATIRALLLPGVHHYTQHPSWPLMKQSEGKGKAKYQPQSIELYKSDINKQFF